MAVEPATERTSDGDFDTHARDYAKFMRMLKIGAIVCFIIAMLTLVVISE